MLAALFIMPITLFAQNITVIYDKNSQYQTNFLELISKHFLPSEKVNLSTLTTDSLDVEKLKNKLLDIIINLNNATTQQLIESKINTTTFHALTTLSRARGFVSCLPNCIEKQSKQYFFVLDQPPARQLNLIRLVSPSFKNIGVIVTNQSKNQLTELKKLATYKKLTINGHITRSKTVRYQIDDLSKYSDVILAIADTDLYNAATLPQILLTSYRYKTPIIGFSKGFIRAGAIVGAVSSIEQLAQHLAEAISSISNINQPFGTSIIYPKYFRVISNRNVAKSLNMHLPNDHELQNQLMNYESTQ